MPPMPTPIGPTWDTAVGEVDVAATGFLEVAQALQAPETGEGLAPPAIHNEVLELLHARDPYGHLRH
eukprot:1260020-Heterocapsa_arctica.AAC.1